MTGSATVRIHDVLPILWATALALGVSAPVAGQDRSGATGTLAGEVVSAETGAPLAGATVRVVGVERSAVTTETGGFHFGRLPVGDHRLRVEYMGHTTEVTGLRLEPAEVEFLTVRLTLRAVPVPGLDVEVASRSRTGLMAPFWARRKLGIGEFFTRQELAAFEGMGLQTVWREASGVTATRCTPQAIDAFSSRMDPNARRSMDRALEGTPFSTADLEKEGGQETLYLPGCWLPVMTRGRQCRPAFVVDGSPLMGSPAQQAADVSDVDPRDVQGVEIYRGPSEIPGIYRMRSDCGLIVLWTRTGA
jgi:hypothetical protein